MRDVLMIAVHVVEHVLVVWVEGIGKATGQGIGKGIGHGTGQARIGPRGPRGKDRAEQARIGQGMQGSGRGGRDRAGKDQ